MRDQLQGWFGRVTKAVTAAAWGTFAALAGPWTEGPGVTEIRLHLEEAARESLRRNPRQDVVATVELNGVRWEQVHVHLKGSTGSFRPLDERPSWTLDLDDRVPQRRFRGTSKFHLNNAAEDPSFFGEWLGHAAFARAGIPSPEVSHAVVWLGDRRIGVYVMKEGFTDEFLQRHWPEPGWALFEPVRGSDVDGTMVCRAGSADAGFPKGSATSKRAWLDQLDSAAFLRFQSVEVLLAHRDGYTLARNNYRILVEPRTGRLAWLPHGMDQVLQPVELTWNPVPAGAVARWLREDPDRVSQYAAVARQVYAEVFAGSALEDSLEVAVKRVLPVITPTEARSVRAGVEELKGRLRARQEFLRGQTFVADRALVLGAGPVPVTGWQVVRMGSEGGGTQMECSEIGPVLELHAAGPGVVAWRAEVVLGVGRYRWSGRVRNTDLEPLAFGQNHGVALRVSGDRPRASGGLQASPWRPLAVEFSVTAGPETVQLNCELRAANGTAQFALGSLQLEKLE
ncbi:MAG: CotH kinase family protein [Verrucomicrobia bacterium]|nr:CotH kinase family protein [Verrucomicrobiota bacterium]